MDTTPRTYQYRLYPTPQQERVFVEWQMACLEVYRLCCIQRRIALYRKNQGFKKKQPSRFDQSREVTQLRKDDPWLMSVPADTMGRIVERVDIAYQKSWKHAKSAKTRFRHPKWGTHNDMGLTFRGDRGTAITCHSNRNAFIKLAASKAIGILKFRQHRPLPSGTELRQVHIVRKADGWYISLSCLIPMPAPKPPHITEAIGVDIGCIHEGNQQRIAVVNDGRVYVQRDGVRREAVRMARLQKLVSERRVHANAKCADPHSKRTARRRKQIAKLHQRIARQREHSQHFIAKRLVDTAQTVVFESLNHIAMRKRGKNGNGRRKRGLNKSLSSAAPGRLMQLAAEKAAQRGRTTINVDAKYTSQICSSCGHKPEKKKGLNIRVWTCTECKSTHDRDINAARNILHRGLETLGVAESEPQCMRGLRGEGATVIDCEQSSMNREAVLPQPVDTQEPLIINHDRSHLSRNPTRSWQLSFDDYSAVNTS